MNTTLLIALVVICVLFLVANIWRMFLAMGVRKKTEAFLESSEQRMQQLSQ